MSGHGTGIAVADQKDLERFRLALAETKSFVYENLLWLVVVSVGWFFASLPILTLGLTTLGAYAAIHSLRERHTVDRGYVAGILRKHGLSAVLVGLFPLVIAGGTALYLRYAASSGTILPLVIGLFGVYLVGHSVLVTGLTLVLLAGDEPLISSLRTAYLITVNHVTVVLMLALVTFVLFVGTLALTAGFVLLFPTLAFSFQVLLVRSMRADVDEVEKPAAEAALT